ncbi:MAG TPA: hypothetical protein VMZ69_03685 [Saprospiraceae bacterium]|nr:hypothetical protein [Saprospiraceae bacterium]
MKSIISIILFALVLIVGYMYFFGKGEDKERATEVVNETKELGRAVGDFIKRQKEKYDDGDFDRLIDKINDNLEKIKSKKSDNPVEQKDELKELEKELKQVDPEKLNDENRARLKKVLEELEEQIERAE